MVSKAGAIPIHTGLHGLESLYGRHGFVALTVAIDLHLVLIGAYLLSALLARPETAAGHRPGIDLVPYPTPGIPAPREIPGPRSLPRPNSPKNGAFKPVITPTPFDDSAFARDLPGTEPWSPGGGSEGIDGDGSGVSDDGTGTGSMPEALPDTSVYPFVERQPIPVKVVNPDYPSEARRLALDGSVTVRVLVERDGRVSKASIVQSTNDMFNECAEGAALKWIFVPGMMTNGPVRVWVAIPFRFALAR